MSGGVLLALAAGCAGVFGAWEALAEIDLARVSTRLRRTLRPLTRARREGRDPSTAEAQRLGVLAAGCLLAGGWLLGGLAVGLIGVAVGPVAVLVAVRVRRRRYAAELSRGAPALARALADALGAGHSVRGALVSSAEGLDGAAGHALTRAARSLELGEPTQAVLEGLRRRARSRGWDTMVAAILLQHEAGGDLATLLRELAASLEAAGRLEREAETATAQARFTAWLVLALPAGAVVLLELGEPGFVAGLATHRISVLLGGLALILQGIAAICVVHLARPRKLT